MNPLGRNMSKGQPSNPMNNMLQLMNGGMNPEQLLKNNPNANAMITQLKQMAGGKSPKEFAMEIAKQRGIDPDQLMQLVNRLGHK